MTYLPSQSLLKFSLSLLFAVSASHVALAKKPVHTAPTTDAEIEKTLQEAAAQQAAASETAGEGELGAKLVVDGKAGATAPSGTTAAAIEAATPVSGAVTGEAKPEARADIAKIPENQIPVLASSKEVKKAESTNITRVLLSLGVLTVLLGGATYALKRWAKNKGPQNDSTKIRILTQHAIGPKKSLAIIQVAGESILVGITDHNISMLKTLALIDDEVPQDLPNRFDSALDEYVDEEAEEARAQSGRGKKRPAAREDFAMRGLSEIRDTVSTRLKSMKNL